MKKYLYGKSALLHWGVPDIENPTEELNAHPEFVIFSRETCYRPKGLGIHTCKFLKAEKYTFGISSTPALAFLQVASEFSVHQLILLGQILCSFSFSNDTDRAAILESEGYQVISVKPKQLKNLRSYSTLIQNIHKRIGKQLRVRSVKFYTGFVQLWELIQNHSPFSSPQLNRSHYEKVRLSDVPCFPGVDAKYNEYLNSWDERVKKY